MPSQQTPRYPSQDPQPKIQGLGDVLRKHGDEDNNRDMNDGEKVGVHGVSNANGHVTPYSTQRSLSQEVNSAAYNIKNGWRKEDSVKNGSHKKPALQSKIDRIEGKYRYQFWYPDGRRKRVELIPSALTTLLLDSSTTKDFLTRIQGTACVSRWSRWRPYYHRQAPEVHSSTPNLNCSLIIARVWRLRSKQNGLLRKDVMEIE